jgi:hypothetical protein
VKITNHFKTCLVIVALAGVLVSASAPTFTNSTSADSFVRAAAPALNYGGAGAGSVSGNTATNAAGVANGPSDTFLRFNTAAMIAAFNSTLGNDWAINRAALRVTEQGGSMNAVFNRGIGRFEIRWIANDNWTEGTGTPQMPAAPGITYNDEAALLTEGTDITLGTFTNAGADVTLNFALELRSPFLIDLKAGGDVGLFLTTVDAGTGFTFSSRSFGTASARPYLEISAVGRPQLRNLIFSGMDVNLLATNGITGQTYVLLTSTNLTLPVGQWTRVATNVLATSGDFVMTATSAQVGASPARFFLLQTE